MSPENEQLLVQEIAPRIRGSLSHAVQVGADDPAELAQDGIAIAAALLASAEARGKKVSAGNVAFYATRLLGRAGAAAAKARPTSCPRAPR